LQKPVDDVNMNKQGVAQMRTISQKNFKFRRFQAGGLLCWVLGTAIVFGIAGACSREHYKAEADKEVYQIIDSKWQDSFGHQANYRINDVVDSPNDVRIEKAVPPSGVISLAQAVAIATTNNRDYQQQKELLYLTALRLTLTRHQFARQWFGTIDGQYAKGLDEQGNEYEDTSVNSSGGFDHTMLLANGVQISTGLAIDWIRYLSGDPRTSLGSVLTASVTAPLLGAGAGKVARENLTQAERDALYQIRSFNRYRKTFVVDIVNNYYRVLQQRDRVINEENSYKSVVESKKRLDIELEAGIRSRFEVDEAGQDVLSAENGWVVAQQSYEQSIDLFKIMLSLPTDTEIELDPNELKALEDDGISELNYTPDTAIETALNWRLDLANSKDAIEDATRKVVLAAEGLGVQLNLTGSAGVSSTPNTNLGRLQFHRGTYGLGLGADLPLDRKAERNAYREALITLEQKHRAYENNQDNIELEVREALRDLKATAEQYRILKAALHLAESRVESNKLLLATGQGDVRLLLQSEQALLRAQNSVTAALVDHKIAKLSFFRDVALLQVKPDGMWEEAKK
jgi:outer membrane protein TolC